MALCTNVTNTRAWALSKPMAHNLSDCRAPSIWLVHLYRTMYPDGGSFPIQQSSTMLNQLYHHHWSGANATQRAPVGSELVNWFSDNLFTCRKAGNSRRDVAGMLMEEVHGRCRRSFCGRLPWQGNADQAGRGVSLFLASSSSSSTWAAAMGTFFSKVGVELKLYVWTDDDLICVGSRSRNDICSRAPAFQTVPSKEAYFSVTQDARWQAARSHSRIGAGIFAGLPRRDAPVQPHHARGCRGPLEHDTTGDRRAEPSTEATGWRRPGTEQITSTDAELHHPVLAGFLL